MLGHHHVYAMKVFIGSLVAFGALYVQAVEQAAAQNPIITCRVI